eukprot:1158101-Pelagomonas_calceolata.AAC.14
MVLLVMELLQLMLLMVRYSVVVVLLHAHGLWVAVALCVGHDGDLPICVTRQLQVHMRDIVGLQRLPDYLDACRHAHEPP